MSDTPSRATPEQPSADPVMNEAKPDPAPPAMPFPETAVEGAEAVPPAILPATPQPVKPDAAPAPPPVPEDVARRAMPDPAAAAQQGPEPASPRIRPPARQEPTRQPPDQQPPKQTSANQRLEPASPAQKAPAVSLSGTDSPSDARSWGDRVLPAAPDAVFHNRPPEYPRDAAMRGEHGIVVILVHISPAGTAAGVDLVRSSGYVLLDSAARQAVMRWQFLPAVKDGQPVASEMTMGFDFTNR